SRECPLRRRTDDQAGGARLRLTLDSSQRLVAQAWRTSESAGGIGRLIPFAKQAYARAPNRGWPALGGEQAVERVRPVSKTEMEMGRVHALSRPKAFRGLPGETAVSVTSRWCDDDRVI